MENSMYDINEIPKSLLEASAKKLQEYIDPEERQKKVALSQKHRKLGQLVQKKLQALHIHDTNNPEYKKMGRHFKRADRYMFSANSPKPKKSTGRMRRKAESIEEVQGSNEIVLSGKQEKITLNPDMRLSGTHASKPLSNSPKTHKI